MTHRHVLTAAAAALATAGLWAAGPAPAVVTAAAQSPRAGPAAPAVQAPPALAPAPEMIGANGVPHHIVQQTGQALQASAPASTFAGVALDVPAGMVDLYLTDDSPAARERALASVPAGRRSIVRVHRVALTKADLDRDMQRVGALFDRLVAAHVPIQLWGPEFQNGDIEVDLLNPTPAQRQAAAAILAGIPVRFATATAPLTTFSLPAPSKPAAPRSPAAFSDCTGLYNAACDSAPWRGGDFIYDSNGYNCTDSWPVSLNHKTYLLTAGHCDMDATWFNGSEVASIGGGATLGGGSQNLLSSHELDAQLISVGSVKPSIWTGLWPGNTANPFASAARDPVVGDQVCADGAYSGTVCNVTVGQVDYCAFFPANWGPTFKMCGLASATRPGAGVSGQGDSGGPIFAQIDPSTGGAVTPVGILTGGSGNVQPCPKQYAGPTRTCKETVLFTMLSQVLAAYGATLVPPVVAPQSSAGCQDTVQPANASGTIDFYHGTSGASAQAIEQNGIDPSLGSPNSDFGAGFYITTDRNQAVQWANSPRNNFTNPTVIHFQVPAAVLTSEVACGRVFAQNGQVAPGQPFYDFVRSMRTTQPNPGGAGYDFVEGPLMLNVRQWLDGAPPLTGGQQDAIFVSAHSLASAFDFGLADASPAGASAPFIVGHAKHAGDDYPYETVGQFDHQNEGTDAWNEYYGQCDSFAAWKVYENLSPAPQRPNRPTPAVGWKPGDASVSAVNQFAAWVPGAGPGGNADVWATQALSWGAAVDNVPTPGAIAWWDNAVTDPQDNNPPDPTRGFPGSSTGHVGYVTDVYPDGSINVEQYNARSNGEYSLVHMAYNSGYLDASFGQPLFSIPWPTGFIHIGDGPAPGVASPAEPPSGAVSAGYPAQVTVIGPADGRDDFTLSGSPYPNTTNGWYLALGHGEIGQELWTNTHPGAANSTATWSPHLSANVCYEVDAFVPDTSSDNDAALYFITDQRFGNSTVPINENDTTNDWAQLGVFQAQGNGTLPVTLTDQGSGTGQVAADAMRFLPQSGCSGAVRASQTIDVSNGAQLSGVTTLGNINGWYPSLANGQLGNQVYTFTNGPTPSSSATWTASVIPNACYELFAYVPGNHANSYQALYTITSGGGGTPVVSVDDNGYTNSFAGLGTYRADGSGRIVVVLTDQSQSSGDAYVTADTMSFVHAACPSVVEGATYPSLTAGPGSSLGQFSLAKDWYNRFGHGDLGYEKWTNTNGSTAVSVATWAFTGLPQNATYSVCAFIPDNFANNPQAHYQGFVGVGSFPATPTFDSLIDQATTTGWTYLGTLATTGSDTALLVALDDTGPTGTYTAADAVRLTTGSC